MPGFPCPGRPGGERDEPLLDMIIARCAIPPDAPQPMHDLARMLAALAGPAEPGELEGEAAVRAAFSRSAARARVSSAARRPVRHRRPRRARGSVGSRARLATVMVAAVAGLGSVLAAYTDVLPSPIQQLAHVAVAAPAPIGTHPGDTLGTGHHAPRKVEPAAGAGQPAPTPDHSAVPASSGGQRPTPTPSHKALFTSSPGRRPPGPICSRVPVPTTGPSSGPGLPGWLQCTGLPTRATTRPTNYPDVPLTPRLTPRLRSGGNDRGSGRDYVPGPDRDE